MKLASLLWLVPCFAALASTDEQINKSFTVQPGGTIIVDVDFGAISVATHPTGEVALDVWRRVSRRTRSAEASFLRDHPVQISREGNTVTVRCRDNSTFHSFWSWSWFGHLRNRNEAKYTITLPAQFNARLRTSGGGIQVNDLAGEVTAHTSGGGLRFMRLRGPLVAGTSGGGIQLTDCQGTIQVHTSGGGIEIAGGSGTLDGGTSGGSVTVKHFRGPTRVGTSGGGITIEDVAGAVSASTSGGSIHATLPSPELQAVDLSTSGGGVSLGVPETAAFDLDASTSGGHVTCDLPVTVQGRMERRHLQGRVNSGGKPVRLHTSGGNIHVLRLMPPDEPG